MQDMVSSHASNSFGEVSPRTYWVLSLLIVAAYLALWLANFRYVYGWHADDWACYVKGLSTVEDPKAAFTVRINALQPYFFLYSYLPIRSGISMPSYELPIYGTQTGNYRFLLLWTILYHGLVALSWAWFAGRIAGNRTAALISTVLLVSSQEFVLWTPLPETRFAGLPLALLGIWLLGRSAGISAGGGWRRAGWLFLAGSLFGLAQSLHYTVLYLIVPMAAAVWLWELGPGRRRIAWWLGWAAFAAGCLWLQGLLELLSRYWAGVAWSAGPTSALYHLWQIHKSPYDVWHRWQYLSSQWLTMVGWPLSLAAVVGAWAWLRKGSELPELVRTRRALAAGIGLAIGLVLLSNSMPFLRKFSSVLPFVGLLAGLGVLHLSARLSPRPVARTIACLCLLAAICIVPLRVSAEVFQGHLGLGRAIHWAHQHRGNRALRWIVVHRPYIYTLDDLREDDPDNWVITYFPSYTLMGTSPSLAYCLEAANPLYRLPNLWATTSAQAVHELRSHTDAQHLGILSETRVYRAGDLAAHLQVERTLRIAQVKVDSTGIPQFEPANLFDHDASPDAATSWVSAASPSPHWVRLTFENSEELDSVAVVQHLWDAPRIGELHVRVAGGEGPLRTVWVGRELQRRQVIVCRFDRQGVKCMELLAWSRGKLFEPSEQVQIEEILFPGCRVQGPAPSRPLAPLVLHSVERAKDDTLLVVGEGITPNTRLVVDGRPMKTDHKQINRQTALRYCQVYPDKLLRVRLADDVLPPGRELPVWLSDGLRQSNPIVVERRGQAIVMIGKAPPVLSCRPPTPVNR